ncbi:serine carboxypeptidase-like 45 [Vitis vinifera]|uniref:Carboxypeptidase n=2 Tax=Vitis vinifera TaxID=29760 RepID=A0A438J7M6_VITVI|nr:serine carboxypeptidase-like 45 [Vitis vinifera]RVX04959.1 Serine carboxypeptidase-like 45 [Vitis vinifera]
MKLHCSWMVVLATLCVAPLCFAMEPVSESDKLGSLPGQPHVSFQQFGGYVTIDEKQGRALFYYFVEAVTDPTESKPLVLWLTGGPGCSSLGGGAFMEHGPFRPRGNTLLRNKHSWNREANMLYVESPAGVGFSYSRNKSFYDDINDEVTARDNLAFLEGWFMKFPKYRNRELFITGESYAGHYVPQLAQLVINSGKNFNLKGILIGNPLLEFDTDMNAQGDFFWSHGLISDSTHALLTSTCNYSQIMRWVYNISESLSPECYEVYNKSAGEIGGSVDPFDVLGDKCLSSEEVCLTDEVDVYLNRKDVQKSLHAQLVGTPNWTLCYPDSAHFLKDAVIPSINVVEWLVRSGIRASVYSGDQDSRISLIGTRSLLEGLAKKLKLKTTVPYRNWFEKKQVGGWTQVYGDILSFATIRGGSHTAPISQPARSLALFTAFLEGKPLPDA